MIGQTISHYKILEKSRLDHGSGRVPIRFIGSSILVVRLSNDGRSSFRSMSGTGLGGGGMSQKYPRAFSASGSNSEDPPRRSESRGVA